MRLAWRDIIACRALGLYTHAMGSHSAVDAVDVDDCHVLEMLSLSVLSHLTYFDFWKLTSAHAWWLVTHWVSNSKWR